MSRKKLVRVRDLDKATTRLSAVKSIDTALDLANGITIPNYEAEVKALIAKIELYNTTLSTIDDLYNDYIDQLEVVKDWNERVLSGVATKFGKDSSQYEMAGGKRKRERRKPTPKK